MTDQEIIERYRAIEAKMPQKKDSTAYDQSLIDQSLKYSLRYAIICENEVIELCTLAFSKLLLEKDEIYTILIGQRTKESCADAIIKAQKEKLECQPNS